MRENLLRRCLQALRKNVNLPYHVIIINDGKRSLSFADERIKVVNNPERKGLGAARQQFAELVRTEYMFFLDNDVYVHPYGMEAQIEALDENPNLAVVSGLGFTKGEFPYHPTVADFKFVGNMVFKRKYELEEIFASEGSLFKADFVPISHTTFRMKAVRDIRFDSAYIIGYEHWDIFMQLYKTDWECAVHKKSYFSHLKYLSPRDYIEKEWHEETLIQVSKKHFIEKWGYRPIDAKEKNIGRALSMLNAGFNLLKSPYSLRSLRNALRTLTRA
jgi:GT2 family glycosyltransferase